MTSFVQNALPGEPAPASPGVFLSFIVPAYAKAAQLPRLLKSLTAMGSHDAALSIEVIVVDDASPDHTAAVAAQWAQRDPSIRLVRHAANGGVHAARNSGMAVARGTWLAFIDADDYLNADGVSRVVDTLRQQALDEDVVFFGFTSDQGEPTGLTHAGFHSVDEVFTGVAFRTEKNCLLCVRARIVREHAISWYYTNLDSLFWREVVYRSRDLRALCVEPAVGVYDTSTVGSLKKLRNDPAHMGRHANAKVEAVFRFLDRVGDYLKTSPKAAEAVIWFLLLGNLKYAKPKGRFFLKTVGCAFRFPLTFGLRLKLIAVVAIPFATDFGTRHSTPAARSSNARANA
jgi:glycosyltransferase involved in cell wall biosynthesis